VHIFSLGTETLAQQKHPQNSAIPVSQYPWDWKRLFIRKRFSFMDCSLSF